MSVRTCCSALVLLTAVASSIATSSAPTTIAWSSGDFYAHPDLSVSTVDRSLQVTLIAPQEAVLDATRDELMLRLEVDLGTATHLEVTAWGPAGIGPITEIVTASGLHVFDIPAPLGSCDVVANGNCENIAGVDLVADGDAIVDVEFWLDAAGPTPPNGQVYPINVAFRSLD